MVPTRAEMVKKISSIGLKKLYKPINDTANIERDPGRERIMLECRRPATITDGVMKGVDIDIYDDNTVRVWTSQKQKATRIAKANGFKLRLMDGEAELYIPISKADEFLHDLGAKVRHPRILTPEQRQVVVARFAKVRENRKVALATLP